MDILRRDLEGEFWDDSIVGNCYCYRLITTLYRTAAFRIPHACTMSLVGARAVHSGGAREFQWISKM